MPAFSRTVAKDWASQLTMAWQRANWPTRAAYVIAAWALVSTALHSMSQKVSCPSVEFTSQAWAAPTEPPTLAPSAVVINDSHAYRIVGNTMQFFFASGKADLLPESQEGLSALAQQLSEGRRIQVSGVHDNTGSVRFKDKISRQRAQTIKQALLAMGVKDQQVELKPPTIIEPIGNVALARRVEVTMLQ